MRRKWKITFSGFAYVEAETSEEADELCKDDCEAYRETTYDEPEEVEEFVFQL